MEVHARVVGEPGADRVGVVRRRIVEHDVEVTRGVGARDLLHEPEEVRRGVSGAEPVGHLAGGNLQGRVEIGDAVAAIVVGVRAARPARNGRGGWVRSSA